MIVDIKNYDGNLIHNRFAYTFFKKRTLPIGNIVTFRSPMLVEADGMIDHEDVLQNDFIYSDDAINFCWEIPGLDSFGAVAWQRLFNTGIANILQNIIKAPIEVDGDDLIVHKEFSSGGIIQPKGKCSVSITYTKDGAALGHTGINVRAGDKAPSFAYSTNMSDEQVKMLQDTAIEMFYAMNDDIFLATTKIISK
jgi:hypothetical protein